MRSETRADGRRYIFSGIHWEEDAGYARAVVDGRFVFVAGTTGYDPETGEMPTDVAAQARNALARIRATLAEAGAEMRDIVRVTLYLTDRADLPALMPIFKEAYDGARPAATGIIAQLVDPAMRIEVEVTALKPA